MVDLGRNNTSLVCKESKMKFEIPKINPKRWKKKKKTQRNWFFYSCSQFSWSLCSVFYNWCLNYSLLTFDAGLKILWLSLGSWTWKESKLGTVYINLSETGLRWVRTDYKVISVWHRGGLVMVYLQISTQGVSEDCRSENADQQTVENLALTNWCLNKLCFSPMTCWLTWLM